MMPKVLAAHRIDQKNLIRLANEIKKCGSVKNAALRKATPPRNDYLRNSKFHQRCRQGQAVLHSSKVACMNQQRALYKEKVLRCNYFAQISKKYGTQKANAAVVKKAGSEKVEQYIRRISGTICGRHVHGNRGQWSKKGGWGGGLANGFLDQYLRAKERCERAKRAYNNKVKECKRKYAAYQVKRGKCNQYQVQMDSMSCKHAIMVKDTCEAYAGCYYSKRRDYRIFERKARAEETDRKAEWRGLKRMECLIKAFADGKVTNAEVDTCKKMTVNTKHLTLKYPKIPPLAKCTIPTLYPATGAYKRREFKPLPTLAKGLQSAPCSGMEVVPTKPRNGSPRGAKCTRVAMLGYYSPGALIKCTNGLDVRRSKDKNSCPRGTKIFSPATRSDWRTFLASAGPLRAPHWIIDVTRPYRGCGGCRGNPMNSQNKNQKTWTTSDGSPWWLRSRSYNEPNGDYSANCFLDLWHGKPRNENYVSFNDGNCNYHSKSYYCQPISVSLRPKSGSPKSCKCSRVELSGKYLAGVLVACKQCLAVRKSTQKNSCPNGMKIFSPASRGDWKTVLASAPALRAPHFIVDVTRPQNGCGGCKKYAMKSSTPQQATWRTSDGSPWWLRSTPYNEPNGDYHANCFLNMHGNPTSPDTLHFNDHNCAYHSRSYYCQPTRANKNYGGFHRRRRAPVVKPKPPVKRGGCFKEEQFYIGGMRNLPNFGGRKPSRTRNVGQIWYSNTGGTWPGWSRSNDFAARWSSTMNIKTAGNYRFFASSDDGSKVFVDGALVVNNDGLHGLRRKEGTRRLASGPRRLVVAHFERGGHAGMYFGFKGPDTKNRWERSAKYGGALTCPKKKAAGMKPGVGVLLNYDQGRLFRAGWKVWSDVPYRHHTVRKDIQPTKGDCVLWGSNRSSGDTRLDVAAFGRRKVIENKKRVWENGVYWYTQTLKSGSGSNGFSPNGQLSLNSADTQGSSGEKRLSWHLHTNFKVGGYRSGKTTGLNSNSQWRKVVMYGPCSGVKGGKAR